MDPAGNIDADDFRRRCRSIIDERGIDDRWCRKHSTRWASHGHRGDPTIDSHDYAAMPATRAFWIQGLRMGTSATTAPRAATGAAFPVSVSFRPTGGKRGNTTQGGESQVF